MSWAYEGIEGYVLNVFKSNYAPLYRAWNGSDHFYTSSKNEYDSLPKTYKQEGIACYIATSQLSGHVPFYRLYSGTADDHFYCISTIEKDNAVKYLGYTYEGIVGYVIPQEVSGYVPLFRAWNPEIGDHFYTTDVSEIDKNGPTKSKGDLKTLLESQLSGYLKDVKMFFADANYFCPTESVAKQIINASKVAQQRYIAEVHDCDDFAFLLKSAFIEDAYDSGRRTMPYAFGIIWGSNPAHAMNIIIIGDGSNYITKIVEPQTGAIYSPSDDKLKEIYFLLI